MNGDIRRAGTGSSRVLADLAKVGALAALYFYTAKLGLKLAFFNPSATPVWPPTGIALAVVLLWGYRVWPGILLGAFLANLTINGSIPTSIGIATGNTLEALLGAWLVQRFANGPRAFERAGDIFKFTLLAAVLSTMVSATFGVNSLAMGGGNVHWDTYFSVWLTWWIGDMVSALLITPLILIWSTTPFPRWSRLRIVEALLMLTLVILVGWIVFSNLFPPPYNQYPKAFLCFPPLLWAAFRFGPRGASSAAFALSGVALGGTLHGFGPFVLNEPNESLLLVQAFVGTITVTNLVLGAVVSERRRAENSLRQSQERLLHQFSEIENLYETAPVGLCLVDTDLRYVRINERLAAINGRPGADHIGRTIREVLPELADTLEPIHRRVIVSGQPSLHHEITGTTAAEPGVQRQWLASYYPVQAADGKVLGVGVVVEDITERKLAERRLAANFAVTRILAESPALSEATPKIVQAIGETLGWQVGALWTPDADASALRCLKLWHASSVKVDAFEKLSYELALKQGIGLPGRVWSKGQPVWIPDVTADGNFPRASFAAAEGLHAAFAFPIQAGQTFLGVMEFFSHEIREPDPALLAMFASIGSQIGQFMERKRAEEALRATQAQLQLIADTTPVMLTRCSRDQRYLFANRACAELLGLTPEQIAGKPIPEIMGEKAYEAIRPYVDTVLRGLPVEYETEVPYQRIGTRFMRVAYSPEKDEQGQVVGWVAAIADITERKLAEQALHEREERFRMLADSVPVHIWMDDEHRRGVFVNARVRKFAGLEPDAAIENWTDLIHPEDRAAYLADYEQAGARRGLHQGTVRLRGQNGNYRWFDVVALPRYEGSRFVGYVGCSIDITERKAAEESLRESEARFRNMAEAAPVMIWMSGRDKQRFYFNRPWLEFRGRTLEQELGSGWVNGVHAADVQRCLDISVTAFDARSEFQIEYRLRRHDGEYRWILDHGVPRFTSDQEFAGYIGSCVDITEHKQAEQRMQKLNEELESRVIARTADLTLAHQQLQGEIDERRRLEAQIAHVSEREQQRLGQELHDGLGQRLTGISFMMGALEMRLEKVSASQAREARRLQQMIAQSIELTRNLAHGFYPVDLERRGLLFALEHVAHQTEQSFGISCRLESDGSSYVELKGQRAIQLFRIAQEAVHNAVKHAQAKQVVIHLAIVEEGITLTVQDDGRGLPADLDSVQGMGLRIMHYRARMIGGRLDLRNDPAGGVTVTCSVPDGKGSTSATGLTDESVRRTVMPETTSVINSREPPRNSCQPGNTAS